MSRRYIVFVSMLVVGQTLFSAASASTPLPFSDVRDDTTQAALSVLLNRGVVQSSTKFYPGRMVNRAEFAKMSLAAAFPDTLPEEPTDMCFADVAPNMWYARWVCRLKSDGAQGYAGPLGGPTFFKPTQSVTYAEGLNMLYLAFDLGHCSDSFISHWYGPCIRAARQYGFDLPLNPNHALTRAEAAQLVTLFLVHSDPQTGIRTSSSSSSSVRSSAASSSSAHSSSSSSAAQVDTHSDTVIRSQFILLGEVSPIIGAASFFIDEEPLDVVKVKVNLTIDVPTVRSLLVYDQNKQYLGRATLNPSAGTNRNYMLTLAPGTLVVPKRETRKVYFRADLAPKDAGAASGENVAIANVVVEANGVWSSTSYIKASGATDLFLTFVTARSTITSVIPAGPTTGPLGSGTQRKIGMFTFTGRRSDASAHIDLKTLIFQIEQAGGITLTNTVLKTEGLPEQFACTVNASLVTCSAIPDSFGSLSDAPRTLALYADVAVPPESLSPSLRVTLSDPGSVLSSGSIAWTDGTNTFNWVALDSPIASGTLWK